MNTKLNTKHTLRAALLAGFLAALCFPAKGMAADAFFIGSAGDHNLTTGSNWVGGSAAGDWNRLIFGSAVVDGNLNLNNFNGRSGITLTSGLTQDITILNDQPLIMGAVTSDGFIDMSSAAHNLTINTPYWAWGDVEWNVGAGRTLTINGGLSHDNGNPSSASLTKDGAGTAVLASVALYTGATTINAGTLQLNVGSQTGTVTGNGQIIINSGGTLLGNATDATGYFNHNTNNGIFINEGGTLTVQAASRLSMDRDINSVGGTLASQGGGDGNGSYRLADQYGGLYNFTSAVDGTASTYSAQNIGLNGTVTFHVTHGGGSVDLNVTGNLVNSFGVGGLTKTGNGVMVLTGANTYTGGTTISGGTLQIGNGGSTGSYGTGTVTNNATLVWNNTSGLDVVSSNAITGSGAFTIKAGIVRVFYDNSGSVSSGTITVDGTGSSNSSSYEIWAGNGATIANNFVLNSMGPAQNRGAINQDGGGGLVTLNGSITLAGDSRIGVGGGSWNSMVINGQVTGGGKLYVYESPSAIPSTQLTLTNVANNYSGGTVIENGRLSITDAAALGSGAVTITGANSQLLVDEVTGTIPSNFTLGGGGNPTSTNYAYGNATMVFHNDSQTATLSGTVTLAGDAKFRAYSSGGITNFSNPIGGTGNLTFEAGGATSGHTQYWVLGGSASTFTGNTLVRGDGSANSYLLLSGGALPSGTVLTLEDSSFVGGNDAVFDLNGQNQTLAGLNRTAGAGGLGSFVTNRGGSQSILTVNGSADSVFSGVIGVNTAAGATGQLAGSDNIALVKSGAGSFTLSGANTYTGTTTVNGGTLTVNGSTSTGSAATVSGGILSGSGTVAGTVTVNSSGTINPGTVGGVGILNTGALNITGTYACDISGANSDKLVVNGSLSISTGTLAVSGTLTANSYTIASYTGAAPAFTNVTGLPSGYSVNYATSGQIKLVKSGYDAWATLKGLTVGVNDGKTQDPNHNGLSNLIEYVLNGDPLNAESPSSILPTLDASGTNFVFTFTRRLDSTTDTAQTFQYGSDLSGWTDVTIPATVGTVGVVNVAAATGTDPNQVEVVTVTIPKGVNTLLFGRLKVDAP